MNHNLSFLQFGEHHLGVKRQLRGDDSHGANLAILAMSGSPVLPGGGLRNPPILGSSDLVDALPGLALQIAIASIEPADATLNVSYKHLTKTTNREVKISEV